MTAAWKYDQKISSDPNESAPIIKLLLEQLRNFAWSNRDTFGIHMAMEEAVMNAIKHGNQGELGTTVHVLIEVDADHFYATVTDQGTGFDLGKVPDPSHDKNLGKSSGRGVKLIQHFVDQVEYNERGNSVTLMKQRSTE